MSVNNINISSPEKQSVLYHILQQLIPNTDHHDGVSDSIDDDGDDGDDDEKDEEWVPEDEKEEEQSEEMLTTETDEEEQNMEQRSNTESSNITQNGKEVNVGGDENGTEKETPTRSRKRKRNPDNWKKNIRKRMRQTGLSYVGSRGQQVQPRSVKTKRDCTGNCRYKCALKISQLERESILSSFWKLMDGEKNHFFSKTIERHEKSRNRSKTENQRKYSYAYHFFLDDVKVRVCKEFYLTTLDVSQRRISYYFENKHDPSTSTPKDGDLRGSKTKDRINFESKQIIRNHINSFPRIESHYCRKSSRKEYLESDLSVVKMYRLYLEYCEREGYEPLKEHIYRDIFNSEFNIEFYAPKKDRCDRCEEYRMKEQFNMLTDDLVTQHTRHFEEKVATKTERDKDRQGGDVVVCFDLENVLSCPRANISSFYYRRKLSVYNLTAHCSANKTAYCAIWHEKQAGRGANEIVSALIAILERVADNLKPKSITLWSDSCVAQNRSSAMAFALQDFLKNHSYITEINHKYCEPGHSSIQEVDAIHSCIERKLSRCEIFSPLGIIHCLKTCMRNPVIIIQLRDSHFKRYLQASKLMNYKEVPFSRVKQLNYRKDAPFNVHFKVSFSDIQFTTVTNRQKCESRRKSDTQTQIVWPSIKCIASKPTLSQEKIKDIKAMLKFMATTDKVFMNNLIN